MRLASRHGRTAGRLKTMTALQGASLAPHWAFVVQLREGSPLDAAQLQGRIEHVASGKATTFESVEQALEFMRQVLSKTVPRHR